MDAPSLQLHENLASSIQRAFTAQRPILTHLNADTSWLIQFPYPAGTVKPPGRSRWNIIFDPWLYGPQSDVATFFSTQWHTVDSCVQTMVELSQLLQEIEAMVQIHTDDSNQVDCCDLANTSRTSFIDAVVISHEFTDHCNKRTLLELDPDTPVFATKRAVDLIRSWNHFSLVQEVPSFATRDSDWRKASLHPLPNWLGVSQIVSQNDALDYHSAILMTFNLEPKKRTRLPNVHTPTEGIIYTPHGIRAQDLNHQPSTFTPIKILALLHGLHDIKLSIQRLNLGAHNGLQAQRISQAKYWVSTHDEIKKASGFIAPWLCRKVLTLREALDEEQRSKGMIGDESRLAEAGGVTFADLTSGESLLLE